MLVTLHHVTRSLTQYSLSLLFFVDMLITLHHVTRSLRQYSLSLLFFADMLVTLHHVTRSLPQYSLSLLFTSTKARIFPWRFSMFLTFWCKIQCNRNKVSLYPCLAITVSTPGLLDVVVSMPKLLDVAVSTPDRLYSDDTIFCWLFTWKNLYSFFHVPCYISVVAIFFSYLILDKKENLNRKNLK